MADENKPVESLKPEEIAQLVSKRTALAKIRTLRGMKVPDARIVDSIWADAGLKRGDVLS